MPANLENSTVVTELEKIIPIPKKGNAKDCSNYCTIALISNTSKAMLKNLQTRLQQYMKVWNSRCSSWIKKSQRNQRSNCHHLLDHRKSKRISENHLLLLYWLCQSLCVDHNTLWKILQEMGIPDYLTCLLRNLYASQEATVRTGQGTMDWFQIGKGVCQGCILSPCLFNLYTEYIMKNAGLDEAQAGIKIARWNSNNLRYADDTTLTAVKRNWRASWWR